jgi:hypothetical protein
LLGGRKHHVSIKAADRKEDEACLVRLEENLRVVERGRITIADGADAVLFLISDGKLEKLSNSSEASGVPPPALCLAPTALVAFASGRIGGFGRRGLPVKAAAVPMN